MNKANSPSETGQAGAKCEIEISPAMIAAGVEALLEFCSDELQDDCAHVVEAILRRSLAHQGLGFDYADALLDRDGWEDVVRYRQQDGTRGVLVIALEKLPSPKMLELLASHKDRLGLIEAGLALSV